MSSLQSEPLFLPGKKTVHDLSIIIENFVVYLAQTARNLDVTLDDQQSFAANTAATARSCRFILHNIRRIHLFLTQEAAQVLVQVLVQALVISCLDYCNSLLAGGCAYHPTSAAHPECSSLAGLQPTQVLPYYTAPLLPTLATGGCCTLIHDSSASCTKHLTL